MKHKRLAIIPILIPFLLAASSCRCSGNKPSSIELNRTLTNECSEDLIPKAADRRMKTFMQRWQLEGVSLAVTRNDSLLIARGWGWADKEKKQRMEPSTIMRVASVSKLITACAIMKLREEGRLRLSDTVFGEGGILDGDPCASTIKDRNYYRITVEHLLRHQGGFRSTGEDPLFSTLNIMNAYGLSSPPDTDELLRCVLKRRLRNIPGSTRSYSNIGYLILSKVIEKASGQEYEEYVRKHVLEPAGCFDFHIARNYYKERYKGEARYYAPSNEENVPEFNGSGREVPRCYGGNNIRALSGAGAWVASAPEIARFVCSVDGRDEIPDILTKESVRIMTEYPGEGIYPIGWNRTDPDIGWVRSGTLSGTNALIKYFPDGECWVFITNTGTWKGPRFSRITSGLFRDLREVWSDKLPRRDLFSGSL